MRDITLVTGASGFIGRRLCTRLQESGKTVRALVRNPVAGPWDEIFAADLGTAPVPAEILKGVDTVYHLAGKAHALAELPGEEADYQQVNVEGTRGLLEAAAAAGVRRFVFFSSVKAMGEGGDACLDESFNGRPETPYGRSKRRAEELVLQGTVPHSSVLRLCMVYGPGVKGNLPRMIEAVAGNRFPPLPETGNKRSLVHVDDVVEAAILAAEKPVAAGQIYIVTDGRPCSTRQMYEWICLALDKPVPKWQVPMALLKAMAMTGDILGRVRGRRFIFDTDALHKLIGSAWYSSGKMERELGFVPKYDLQGSLPSIISR